MNSRDDIDRYVEETITGVEPVDGDETLVAGTPRHAPGTSPTNPLPRRPNLRLRKTRPGSVARLLYGATYGDYYPPLAQIRVGGRTGGESAVVDLPTLEDGRADLETHARGFFSDYAHRIMASPTGRIHYRWIRGARP